MFDSIHLTLLIGPLMVPVPAPQPLMDALKSVQVTSGRNSTGFQLQFAVGKKSVIQQALLPAGLLDPLVTRVVIVVTFRGIPEVICDGVITRQEMSPSSDPGQSTLTVTGDDLTVLMDVFEKVVPFPAMPIPVQVNLALAPYLVFGIVPLVMPPIVPSIRMPTEGYDTQTGTDLGWIRMMAQRCGYTFYIEPGPLPLQSLAYFGPDARIPIPQPALSVNSDWDTNVDSLSFSLDGLSKQISIVTILDPVTHKIPLPIPVPNLNVLKPPLGARLIAPARTRFGENLTRLPPDEVANRMFGMLTQGADSVSGSGSLSVTRYGHILRARALVGVRGAGVAYDGLYYVESVTHNIKQGEYKQSFTLARDGLISQTPVVMP